MATKVFVSNDYRETFEAVRKLIRAGAFYGSDSARYEVRGEAIYDGTYEYVLSGKSTDIETKENHFFTPEGATWFKCLRGEFEQNDDAIWYNFMIDVREEYHKLYSVVLYEQLPKDTEELKRAHATAKKVLTEFAKNFCNELNLDDATFRPITDKKIVEDIFGVSMRVELSAESTSGASLPMLCKVYFNRNELGTKPMTWQTAKQYDREIASLIPDEGASDECERSEDVIANTIDAIDKLFNNKEVNFADYTWLGEVGMPSTDDEENAENYKDENDAGLTENERKQRQALRKLYIQMSHENFDIECQRVDLLYISHIKAESYVCDMCINDVPMLRVEMGINNSATIRCLNCGSFDILVDRNEVVYKVQGKTKTAVLELDKEQFGLSDEVLNEVKENSDIKNHFILKSCMNSCSQIKCKRQLFSIKDELYCTDCARQEIIYTDFDGKKYFTPNIKVASDEVKIYSEDSLENNILGVCSLCKRTMSAKNLAGGKCKAICAPASDKRAGDSRARRLYRAYRGFLPLGKRFNSLLKSKRCYEDDELIMFVIGNKKYIFNKLNVRERGYLEKPKELLK